MSNEVGDEPVALDGDDRSNLVRVLVVDDDPAVAELTARHLDRHLTEVDVVVDTDPNAALERLDERRFDCVVSDYEMPETDGLSFLEGVREIYPDLPFILFTGRGSEEIASDAISAGVTDYLQKETGAGQYELLANRIKHAVDRASARAERDRALARFAALTENASFAVVTIDEESRVRYVNDAVTDVLGYEPSTLEGESLLTVMPERFRDAHVAGLQRYVRERTRSLDWSWIEFPAIHADGHEVPLGISFSELERGDGTLFTAILRDITERTERERELERYETLLETVTDGVYALDSDGRYTYVNSWIEAKTGYDRSELLGAPATMLLPEADVEGFERGISEMLAGERDTYETEIVVRTADDERLPAEARITAMISDGDLQGTVGVVRDISARRERERELRQEKALTESLLDVQPDVFYLFDEEGQFLRWNDRFREVTGYSDAEISELTPLDFVPAEDEDRIADAIDRVLDGEQAIVESALVTADGRHIPHEFTGALVTDGDEKIGVAGIGRDVTERARHERELERQNECLEEFASVVSHDLKNPLSVAKGRLDLAEAESESESEHLAEAHEALDEMEQLVENLLELARKGRQVREPRPVRLADAVEAGWCRVAGDADVRIDVGDATAVADEDRVVEVFENLLDNAITHAGPDVTVRVGLLADRTGFYVADDGPGVPPDHREDIFDRGYTTADSGTGFGLSIVEGIVGAHGWTIDVTESERGGTRFEIHDVDLR